MTTAAQFEAATLPVRPGEEPWTEAELAEVRHDAGGEAAGTAGRHRPRPSRRSPTGSTTRLE